MTKLGRCKKCGCFLNTKKEHKCKLHPFLGRKVPQETKQKISEALTGEGNPNYGKPPWNTGRQMTEEHCEKISRGVKEAMKNPEYIEKLRKAKKGEKHPNFGKRDEETTAWRGVGKEERERRHKIRAETRRQVQLNPDDICEVCGKRAEQVHHPSPYRAEVFQKVCVSCHRDIHKLGTGRRKKWLEEQAGVEE